jgi:integrase
LASYRSTVEQYIIPAIGTKQLKKLTPDHVRQVSAYVTGKGLSTRTAALAYQVLALLLQAAYREGKVTSNVTDRVKRPRTKKTELTVLTAQDGMKVLQTVTGWPPPVAIDRLASRWWASFFTGARQGEVIGLEWSRVDFERGVLDLSWQLQRLAWEHGCEGRCGRKRGNECPQRKLTSPADWEHRHIVGGLYWSRPKSEAGKRLVPMPDPLRKILELRQRASVLEDNPHGLVWTQPNGRPLDPRADNEAWHAVLKLAGVPDARLHDARHTTASLLRKAGVPIGTITKIMGHSTQAMSEEYIDYDLDQLSDGLTRMSALLLEPSPASEDI